MGNRLVTMGIVCECNFSNAQSNSCTVQCTMPMSIRCTFVWVVAIVRICMYIHIGSSMEGIAIQHLQCAELFKSAPGVTLAWVVRVANIYEVELESACLSG